MSVIISITIIQGLIIMVVTIMIGDVIGAIPHLTLPGIVLIIAITKIFKGGVTSPQLRTQGYPSKAK